MTQQKYLTDNKLVMNIPKTQMLVSCQPIGRSAEATIEIQGTKIIPLTHMKIVGVILSADRTWTKHINYLIKSVQPRLIAIRQLAKYGSRKVIIQLGQALVASKITYAIQAWGGTTMQNKKRLQVVLNQAARLAMGPTSARMSTPMLMQ